MKKFLKSFSYAFNGVRKAVRTERNMRFHMVAAFYVIIAAAVTKIPKLEWFVILFCFALVMGFELMNTALENLCDAAHPEKSSKIALAKDAAAGAVLVSAFISAVIGILIFFDAESLKNAGEFIKNNIVLTVIIACTLVPAVIFISGRKKNDK